MRSLWTFLGIFTLLLPVVCKKRAHKCPSPICQPGLPDVGRTSTVDAYYTNFVEKILHSVTEQLSKHGNYRFTFAEMAFFHRWWTESDPKTRARVRSLIDRGVLEFSMGGWVTADEATVYYADAIDQLTLGRNFILREFGPCALPRVAWQLDTFGHARDHCGLFIPAGYDAVVFDRIDYKEKQRRFRGKSLQLMWNTAYGPAENDYSASLFTHILSSSYCDEISNNAHRMIARIQDRMEGYQVNHIAFLMGCDFSYTNATEEFQKLDRLIRTIQGREIDGVPVNIFYSTPYCYTQAVNRAVCSTETILPKRSGDFMPYRMQGLAYWTGFYTSRPTIKSMIRQMSLLLHAAEQVSVFATVLPTNEVAIEKLRQEVAILQHHNAITGTYRAAVAKDYLRRVYKSSGPSEVLLSETVRLISSGMIHNTDRFESCRLRNISICLPSTKSYAFILTVYNPLGWAMPSHWVHIPVRLEWPYDSFRIQLLDWKGSVSYPYQLIPVSMQTRRIPERLLAVEQTVSEENFATHTLLFSPTLGLKQFPQLGIQSFLIEKIRTDRQNTNRPIDIADSERNSNWIFSLKADVKYSKRVHLEAKHRNGLGTISVGIELLQYVRNFWHHSVEGVHIFKAMEQASVIGWPKTQHTTGPLMEQISAVFADWASLDLRLYKDDRVEVEWTVGPIPVGGRVHNRNVIIRYTLESSTAQLAPYTPGEFFTDSAGRRLIRRVRGKRPDWNVTQPYMENDRISSNYYPVTNRIVVKGPGRDSNSSIPQMAFAVYPDRAEGASSLTDGQVELMLHRRLLSEDFLGMGEPLDEMGEDGRGLIVRGKHVIRLAEWKVLSAEDRYMAESVTRPPVELFAPSESFNVKDTTLTTWSGLTRQLPAEIHLVSLMRWPLSFKGKREKVNNILLRLDYNPIREERNPHLYELMIHDLFRYMCISQAKEVSLSGDQSISEMLGHRMKWPGETVHSAMTNHVRKNRTGLVLLLQPGKIQTYILTFERFKRTCF